MKACPTLHRIHSMEQWTKVTLLRCLHAEEEMTMFFLAAGIFSQWEIAITLVQRRWIDTSPGAVK